MTTVIGIDPDTTNSGLAVLEEGVLIYSGLVTARGRFAFDRVQEMAVSLHAEIHDLTVPDPLIVIEWQQIRPGDRRPNDILNLAVVAGMALAACLGRWPDATVFLPTPVEWKGSVPKEVHHPRIMAEMNCDPRELPKGPTKSHVIDAIGLALWGEASRRKASRVSEAIRRGRAAR